MNTKYQFDSACDFYTCCSRPFGFAGRLYASTVYCREQPHDLCNYGSVSANDPYTVITSFSDRGYIYGQLTWEGGCAPQSHINAPPNTLCKPPLKKAMDPFDPNSPFTVLSTKNIESRAANPSCSFPPHHFVDGGQPYYVEGINKQLGDCSYQLQVSGGAGALRAPFWKSEAKVRLYDYYSATGYVKVWVALYLFDNGEVSVSEVRTVEVNIPESEMRPYITGNHKEAFTVTTPDLGQVVGFDIVGHSFVQGYTPPHILAQDYDTHYRFDGFPYVPPVIDVYNAPPP